MIIEINSMGTEYNFHKKKGRKVMNTFANRLSRVRDKMLCTIPPTNHIIEVDMNKNETKAKALKKYKLTNEVLPTDHIMFIHLKDEREGGVTNE